LKEQVYYEERIPLRAAARHFTEDSVFNNINNFHDQSIQNNFNPIEKVIELYERLLASKKEKVELLKNQGK
jgi:hypothetical protein